MSRFRKPHGTYTRETIDWFADRRMGGFAFKNANAGEYASVSLYNDASDGSILHVYGLSAYTAVAGSQTEVRIISGQYGALWPGAPLPTTPFFAARSGQLYTNSTPARLTIGGIWMIGQANQSQYWPYPYPIALLAPGYSLVLEADSVSNQVGAAFQYLSMGPDQGLY